MDLSDQETTSSELSEISMSSDISDTSSMIIPFNRDIFLSTYRRQNFTLPDPIMYYIAKNPKNAKFYQKMIKCCKYFFIKNPILVVDYLLYSQNGWETWVNETWKNIDINKISAKLWITDDLSVYTANDSNNSLASSIISKIYRSDFKHLILHDQIISLNELMFLCSSVKTLNLERVTVKNDDGTVVLFENVIHHLHELKGIIYAFTKPSNNTSKNTFKELWKISHLSNYDYFILHNVPEDFDIESFYSYMKKKKNAKIFLYFSGEISEEYKTRLETIIDEIIDTKTLEFKPSFIGFPGLEKMLKLYAMCDV